MGKETGGDINDPNYRLYLEDRKISIDAAREAARTFDKAMLTFTSGAFIFSITFLKDIVPIPFKNTLWLLGCSLLFFALDIVIILCGLLASQHSNIAQIEVTYDNLVKGKNRINYLARIVSFCNWSSIIILSIAFIFAGCFIYWNKIHSF